MEMNGLSLDYFKSQDEALQYADELIRQSESQFGFSRVAIETPGFPLLTKFKYMKTDDKERTWTATETKTVDKRATPSLKQLQDQEKSVQAFLGDSAPSFLAVKIEGTNPAPKLLEKEVEKFRRLPLRNNGQRN